MKCPVIFLLNLQYVFIILIKQLIKCACKITKIVFGKSNNLFLTREIVIKMYK